MVAHATGLRASNVAVTVKRLGGGFGGKESRNMLVTVPVSLAAHRMSRPIRCALDRDEDMMITGTRHPFFIKYEVAFNNDAKIIACKIEIYNNGGYSLDMSFAVSEMNSFSILCFFNPLFFMKY